MTVLLDDVPSTYPGHARYEGANIRNWIGFKQFVGLVEEAVHQYFRDRGYGVNQLFKEYGLGLELLDNSVQLPNALEMEEQVEASVVTAGAAAAGGLSFVVELLVRRGDKEVTVGKAKVRAALVPLAHLGLPVCVPDALTPYVVPDISTVPNRLRAADRDLAPGQSAEAVLAADGSYVWTWRAPYFNCHFSDRLQFSGHVKAMEEVVDRFLYDRGLSIKRLLDERGWIPVVSRARIQMLAETWMEETVYTVFRVEDFLKDVMFTARSDTYARRGDRLVHTSTGTIMHGYALSRGPNAGSVATLDKVTKKILVGGAA
jgi:acyl-CoA thioesterase FadM